MPAPPALLELIARFKDNRESFAAPSRNEADSRQQFVNPLLEAMKWDVANRGGLAENYKPVVVEMPLESEARRPDYTLRIGGIRKMFVEAKSPAVGIFRNGEAAYQLRRYVWSAKLPVGILTNFAEFAVYDCRAAPKQTDGASVGRVDYLTLDDYESRWESLCTRFSPMGIQKGGLDKFIAAEGEKRGTAGVDESFLAEIERWRIELAQNLALRNPLLSAAELNFAVQKTLDRIVFLRICEDRGIEKYGRLRTIADGRPKIYPRLAEAFQEADSRYNSGLFHFRPNRKRGESPADTLTLRLSIDDKILSGIIGNLYYPQSPYAFSVISADILGQVYERFLGSEIRLTKSHRARVEQKPEVRHAGGVYYTPSYVVECIVKAAVDSQLKKSAAPSKLRILDPACGSGSFLLGAYQHLLDWHLEKYLADAAPHLKRNRIHKIGANAYRLSLKERGRILLDSIFGVDIDAQAGEVTKLSLLLKCLEDENAPDLGMLPGVPALPDLGGNIKCGNSLVENDIYAQGDLIPDNSRMRINAFDWPRGFPQAIKAGGFDSVVGNPPYVRQEILGEAFKNYARSRYKVYHGVADLYAYFIERGISLLRQGGRFSFIVANKWLRANYGAPLREFLRTHEIIGLADFGDLPVFRGATTYPCILTVGGGEPQKTFRAANVGDLEFEDLTKRIADNSFDMSQSKLPTGGWSLVNSQSQKLIEKLRGIGVSLREYIGGKIYFGIKTGLNDAFVIDGNKRAELISADAKSAELIKPFLAGRDVKRYEIASGDKYLILIPKGFTSAARKKFARESDSSPAVCETKATTRKSAAWEFFAANYPAIAAHLEPFEKKARKRHDKGEQWWELRTCDYYAEFQKPKIICPTIVKGASNVFDSAGFFSNDKTTIIVGDLLLLAVINSRVADFFLQTIAATRRGGHYEYKPMYLAQIPIPILKTPADKKRGKEIANLADEMLTLRRKIKATQEPHQQTVLTRSAAALDDRINAAVAVLYGLSDSDLKIINGGE